MVNGLAWITALFVPAVKIILSDSSVTLILEAYQYKKFQEKYSSQINHGCFCVWFEWKNWKKSPITYVSGIIGPFNVFETRYRVRSGDFSSIITRNMSFWNETEYIDAGDLKATKSLSKLYLDSFHFNNKQEAIMFIFNIECDRIRIDVQRSWR